LPTDCSDYYALGVKPVDDRTASQYQNSDHAGTAENVKQYVTGYNRRRWLKLHRW
jgi:hypothetical protein